MTVVGWYGICVLNVEQDELVPEGMLNYRCSRRALRGTAVEYASDSRLRCRGFDPSLLTVLCDNLDHVVCKVHVALQMCVNKKK